MISRLMGISHDLGLWFGLPAVEIVSFLAIGVGGLILLADLGKPFRFLRALLNVRSSWISRGAVADFVFLVLATLLILPNLKFGTAMPFRRCPGNPRLSPGSGGFWSSCHPCSDHRDVLCRSRPFRPEIHSLLEFPVGSDAVCPVLGRHVDGILLMFYLAVGKPVSTGLIVTQTIFVGLLLVVLIWHLSTRRENPGKAESVRHLLRGKYRGLFIGAVLVSGTIIPFILGWVAAVTSGAAQVAWLVISRDSVVDSGVLSAAPHAPRRHLSSSPIDGSD